MKICPFILSFCCFCIFYICNADWMDELYEKLIEDYLGSDYEEVAPFISSVTAGTEEFDRLVEELTRSSRKWFPASLILLTVLIVFALFAFVYHSVVFSKVRKAAKTCMRLLLSYPQYQSYGNKDEIQNLVTEYLENKLKQLCGHKQGDDVPVKLLWKGGTLVESSIHCNIRDDRIHQVQRQVVQSRISFKPADAGAGDKKADVSMTASEESTAQKIADIRKLLESEPEIRRRFADKGAGTEDDTLVSSNYLKETTEEVSGKEKESFVSDGSPDSKLMNRIRLLESRLRLEELKNKNWINRMSRAEGILQQLNRQVERIEETRPMGTLTETLKITSTITNWSPPSHPRRNLQFTMVNQYPPFYLQTPYTSLSEVIKKEVGLSSSGTGSGLLLPLPPTPHIPALPSPSVRPSSSFLSKLLSR